MWEQTEAVQRMQDYIDEHLSENITLAHLARASLYSPWYSYRLFTQMVNLTPADYIRRLRLSRSALRLRDDHCRITELAFELGFGSVDGYQRAFFREFGCNPREYAVNPVPLHLFTPYGVKYRALRTETGIVSRPTQSPKKERTTAMETVKSVFVQVIQKPARKALIKRGIAATEYFAYCEEVGCDVWGLLTSIKAIGGEPVCLWLPKAYIKAGTSQYVQGVEVALDYDGPVPDGMEVIELPACSYLMFQGEPFAEEDYGQAIEQVQQAIQKYNPAVIGYALDKENPRVQLEPIGTRGYIELLAVRPLKG